MKGTHAEYAALLRGEFPGDFAAWLEENAEDNRRDLERLKRNLRRVRQAELTARQQQVLQMYFEEEMSVTAIAAQLGVAKSTVSRTLRRGKQRLRQFLQYSL